jgi:hypothetical protein
MADDDLWHVRLAPDEVKQLTLEQLDDLFRLEVIEASTLIWQPGMTEWLPLSVVAGLGEEDPEPVHIAVSEPPTRRMAQTATSWPPQPVRSAPPRSAPPPPSKRSVTPAPPSATVTASSWPPPAAWSNPPPRTAPPNPYASTVPQASQSAPPPSAAQARYVDPFAPPPPSIAPLAAPSFSSGYEYRQSGGGGWIVAFAFAAGLAVTLYRNDIVHAAARNIGQEATYLKLEHALGGPSFGTPRAVETMAAAAAAITTTSPSPSPGPTTAPTATTTVATTATASTSTVATTSTTATSEPAAPSTPAAAVPEPAKATKAAPADAPRSAPAAHRPASNAQSSPEVDPVFKTPKKGKKGKGNEYDPLNPSL